MNPEHYPFKILIDSNISMRAQALDIQRDATLMLLRLMNEMNIIFKFKVFRSRLGNLPEARKEGN